MKKGQIAKVRIEKMLYKGIGLGFIEQEGTDATEGEKSKIAIMVEATIPGEVCEVLILKKKNNYLEGKKIKKLEPSPLEIKAPCKYFGVCGGCKWQHLPYEEQLKYKEKFIRESLTRIGRLPETYEFLPIIPSPEEFFFRNKLEFSFGTKPFLAQTDFQTMREEQGEREEGMYLGFHGAGSFDKIVDVDACFLMSKVSNAILEIVKSFVKKKKLSVYDSRTHEGFLRHLVIRQGKNTGELMVNLITASTTDYTGEFFEPMIEDLLMLEKDELKFESILWSTNDKWSDVAQSAEITVLHGREYIFDKVGDLLFKISPYSFFQTNTKGAERLYALTKEFADLKGGETVIDLYAGTGTIGMYLARDAKKVFAIESEVSSVEDAKVNATMNNIMNIEFFCGKVEKESSRLVFERPDVIVLDPPRAGMHPTALELLPHFGAQKIIYVSCNPTTLARDLQFLSRWYEVTKVQGVDMFPQTYHVETVVQLVRK